MTSLRFSTDPSIRRCLVLGRGSIGRRHGRILESLEASVAFVSRRGEDGAYTTLAPALASVRPDCVVVATETASHAAALRELAALDFTGVVLVEKPLFCALENLPDHRFARLFVTYQLRFHPLLQRMKALLAGQTILSAQIYVGQYLPEWRPDRDYRATYSGSAALGGGALRDLSHELDLADWLLGPWRRLAAQGGHWSGLEIDSDDVFVMLATFDNCPAATIQMNYLDRRTRREIVINTRERTIAADLIAGTLQVDRQPPEQVVVERDDTYLAMHRAILADDGASLCDAVQGRRVMEMIVAAEQSAARGIWVEAAAQPC